MAARSKGPRGARAAVLRFLPDWRQIQDGEIVPGGRLRVEYAADRLPDCRGTYEGTAAWDIVADVLFAPGGQRASGSVGGSALETDVPHDAREAVLWFHNTDRTGCTAWDSRFGENYRFSIADANGTAAPATGAAKGVVDAASGSAAAVRAPRSRAASPASAPGAALERSGTGAEPRDAAGSPGAGASSPAPKRRASGDPAVAAKRRPRSSTDRER